VRYASAYLALGCGAVLLTRAEENRDKLRDQNELSNDVMVAITSNPLGQDIDEAELEDELEQLQQEKLDEQILSTGNVPVSDAVHRMPTAASRERKLLRCVARVCRVSAGMDPC